MMIALLSIFYLAPFFILSLLYSGQFLILLFGYFLNLVVLISENSISNNEAFKYFVIDNLIRATSAILIIISIKSLKDFPLKSLRFNTNFLFSLKKYTFDKKLIQTFICIQLVFISFVLIVSPNLSILSFNRDSTISLTIPTIRYIYPFFIGLSPSLFSCSLLSIISFKKARLSSLHYILLFVSFINIFLIGQRGFLFTTLFVAFLTSFLFSFFRLLKGKLNISKLKYWSLIVLSFPIIYNLRSLYNLGKNKLFTLDLADLQQIKAWEGAINVTKNLKTTTPPIFNNIFNFLNHQNRIDLGIQNSSDIVNTFLFSDFYYDKGFGLNITIPMDLYVSFQGDWLWIPTLIIYYSLIIYGYIQFTKYFLFKKNNLPSYFLITCAFSSLTSGLTGWPLALIFYLESELILFIKKKK